MTMREKIFELKENYDDKRKYDFVLESELTVTITLKEYRDLLTDIIFTEEEMKEHRRARWEAEEEVEKLKNENLKLKEELYYLQNKGEDG